MGEFLGALFGGQNKTLNQDINNFGSLGQYSSNIGQGATSRADDFYKNLLSGNPALMAQVLAPAISAGQQQTQQAKQQLGEFGTRSGGNTASAQTLDTNNRADLFRLIGQLLPQAAGAEAGLGTQNLQLGQNAYKTQAGLSQQQLQNYMNSILGKGLSDVAATGLNAFEGWAGM